MSIVLSVGYRTCIDDEGEPEHAQYLVAYLCEMIHCLLKGMCDPFCQSVASILKHQAINSINMQEEAPEF